MGAWKRSARFTVTVETAPRFSPTKPPCSLVLVCCVCICLVVCILLVVRMWAHALIDSGATVYVSHGDPRLQGIEIYNGCPAFYCLGSFIFQTKTEIGFYGPEVWQSCIVTLEYHTHSPHSATSTTPAAVTQQPDPERERAARTAPPPSPTFSIRLTPITLNEVGRPSQPLELHYQTRGLPIVAKGEEGRRILSHVAAMSAQFGTVVEVEQQDEDGSVVGWVTGGGAVRVGERADPTVGEEMNAEVTTGVKQSEVKATDAAKDESDGGRNVEVCQPSTVLHHAVWPARLA